MVEGRRERGGEWGKCGPSRCGSGGYSPAGERWNGARARGHDLAGRWSGEEAAHGRLHLVHGHCNIISGPRYVGLAQLFTAYGYFRARNAMTKTK